MSGRGSYHRTMTVGVCDDCGEESDDLVVCGMDLGDRAQGNYYRCEDMLCPRCRF